MPSAKQSCIKAVSDSSDGAHVSGHCPLPCSDFLPLLGRFCKACLDTAELTGTSFVLALCTHAGKQWSCSPFQYAI